MLNRSQGTAEMNLRPTRSGTAFLATLLILTGASLQPSAEAQTVIDDSRDNLGAASTDAAIALLGKTIKDPSAARYSLLHKGKAGAICGEIDQQNRMGRYTGPRGFVADLDGKFAGIFPDAPELRYAGSVSEYQAMQRTLALFAANCTTE